MDANRVAKLVANGSSRVILAAAKYFGGEIVTGTPTGQTNTCAATLSCLLDVSGVFVGIEPGAPELAQILEKDHAWTRIAVGDPIKNGDVGVFVYSDRPEDRNLHHIYLVIDATNQASPLVADNQGNGAHHRPIRGGPMPGVGNDASPTNYLLRAT